MYFYFLDSSKVIYFWQHWFIVQFIGNYYLLPLNLYVIPTGLAEAHIKNKFEF